MKKLIKIFIFIFLIFLCGCFSNKNRDVYGSIVKISENEETERYLYIGFGIIELNKKQEDIKILDSKSIGIDYFNNEITIGIKNKSIIFINSYEKSYLIDIERKLFNFDKIKIQKGFYEN